jgi:hypothetical protein
MDLSILASPMQNLKVSSNCENYFLIKWKSYISHYGLEMHLAYLGGISEKVKKLLK